MPDITRQQVREEKAKRDALKRKNILGDQRYGALFEVGIQLVEGEFRRVELFYTITKVTPAGKRQHYETGTQILGTLDTNPEVLKDLEDKAVGRIVRTYLNAQSTLAFYRRGVRTD